MIYDGHSTHINLRLINRACQERVIKLIKLPAHTTDKLQPLDKCCFRPLKAKWDRSIAKWTSDNHAKRISKPEFIELTGETWREVFTENLIKSSFESIGIFPVDKCKYPRSAFNPRLLQMYEEQQQKDAASAQFPPLPGTPHEDRPGNVDAYLDDHSNVPVTPSLCRTDELSTTIDSSAKTSGDTAPSISSSGGSTSIPKFGNRDFEQICCDHLTPPAASGKSNTVGKPIANRRINPQC